MKDLYTKLDLDRLYLIRHLSHNMQLHPLIPYFITSIENISKLVEIARLGLTELRLVVEMFISLLHGVHYPAEANRQLIPLYDEQIRPLVMLVKDHCYDEKVVYCLVKIIGIVCEARQSDLVKLDRLRRLLEEDLVSHVCQIMMQLFSRNPSLLNVKRKLTYPLYFISPDVVHGVEIADFWIYSLHIINRLFCSEDSEAPIIIEAFRILLPLTVQAMKEYGKGEALAKEGKNQLLLDTLSGFMFALAQMKAEDQKTIISEHAIVHLLDMYKNQYIQPMTENRKYCSAIDMFLNFNHDKRWKDPTTRLDLLANLIAIITCEKLTENDLEYFHPNVIINSVIQETQDEQCFADTSLKLVSHLIQDTVGQLKSENEILRALVDMNLVPKLLEFVRNLDGNEKVYLHFLNSVSECLLVIAEVISSSTNPLSNDILSKMRGFFTLVLPFVNNFNGPMKDVNCRGKQSLVTKSIPAMLAVLATSTDVDMRTLESETEIFEAYARLLKLGRIESICPTAMVIRSFLRCFHEVNTPLNLTLQNGS